MTVAKPFTCVILLAFATWLPGQTTLPTSAPANARDDARAQRAVIISIDGLRPDVLLRAEAPNIRRLMRNGAFTFWARSTAVSLTLPTHVSLLTGVEPQVHGIHWNADLPLAEPVYPRYSTVFELAKKAGYSTGAVAGKRKFNVLAKPVRSITRIGPTRPRATTPTSPSTRSRSSEAVGRRSSSSTCPASTPSATPKAGHARAACGRRGGG